MGYLAERIPLIEMLRLVHPSIDRSQAGSTEHQHMQCVSRGISVCKMYRELGRYIIGREISGSTIPIVYCRRELMTVVLELSICGC